MDGERESRAQCKLYFSVDRPRLEQRTEEKSKRGTWQTGQRRDGDGDSEKEKEKEKRRKRGHLTLTLGSSRVSALIFITDHLIASIR